MRHNIHLLVIDAQNDFCDLPADYLPTGPAAAAPALPVAGAHADMRRVAALIDAGRAGISGISATLDSHHRIDIAHPTFWMDGDAQAVAPFTPITAADVRAGRYVPRLVGALPRVLAYLDALEAAGRYTLMVWPVHCEIGTWGHNLHADVHRALSRWQEQTLASVNIVIKGTNPWTEHYSAIEAEVPDARDAATRRNADLIALLAASDRVLICGEAGSHCVRATTEHLVDNLDPQAASRLTLLTDCMSPVGGFEAQQTAFLQAMAARGVQLATSANVLPALRAIAA